MLLEQNTQKPIQIFAHWAGMDTPMRMGTLFVAFSRGKEIFSFEYDKAWLQSQYLQQLDPHLELVAGPQYPRGEQNNFGIFLDSSPDRWGRQLIKRREAQHARAEDRDIRLLAGIDYLLGVYDVARMGALRFRLSDRGAFLDDHAHKPIPPWTKLRALAAASERLEQDKDSTNKDDALELILAQGSSLGGARPKIGVLDDDNHPWIAKFPSRDDEYNVGKWEYLTHILAEKAGITVAPSQIARLSNRYDTFLTKRFDRTPQGTRIHFASAMTMLSKTDGDSEASYLDIVHFLMQFGAQTTKDLQQLWRRIVFFICVSNTDDHLRNHGFILTDGGWRLSPAYDMNPVARGDGLNLNISQHDNSQNLQLALDVAEYFRIPAKDKEPIMLDIITAVKSWPSEAQKLKLTTSEQAEMKNAFRIADNF